MNLPSPHPHGDAVRHRAERGRRHRASTPPTSPRTGWATAPIYGDSAGRVLAARHVHDRGGHRAGPRSWACRRSFLIKPPSDGLTGLTDEDNLGFTYHVVNEYIRKGEVDPAIKEQIDHKHKTSALQVPDTAGVSEWIAHRHSRRDGLL